MLSEGPPMEPAPEGARPPLAQRAWGRQPPLRIRHQPSLALTVPWCQPGVLRGRFRRFRTVDTLKVDPISIPVTQ